MNEFVNLTALGEIYGVAAADVGRWLKGLMLRDPDGRPTRQALADGYCKERVSEFGSTWLWHKDRVCELLDAMCYERGGQLGGVEVHDGFVIIRGK